MLDKSSLQTFSTFSDADQADREERWAMLPSERLNLLEQLRSHQYPDGKTPPRLQRILTTTQFPPS